MSKCAREDQNCSCLNRVYGKDCVPKGQNHRERMRPQGSKSQRRTKTIVSIHQMGCVTYMSSNIGPVSNKININVQGEIYHARKYALLQNCAESLNVPVMTVIHF